jgi:hypothetical protein
MPDINLSKHNKKLNRHSRIVTNHIIHPNPRTDEELKTFLTKKTASPSMRLALETQEHWNINESISPAGKYFSIRNFLCEQTISVNFSLSSTDSNT